jgi:hypothetical protein
MEHAFLRQVGERVAHLRRQPAFAGQCFGALAMDLVPGAAVVLGRLHQASSE